MCTYECVHTLALYLTAHVNMLRVFLFFFCRGHYVLDLSSQRGSAAGGSEQRERAAERQVQVLKVRADCESSVMDEGQPSSRSHLHTENCPLTQLLSNNVPQLNPRLSYRMLTTVLDCFHLASATISHFSVFLPAASNATRLTVMPFKTTLCLWFCTKSCQVYVYIPLS